MNGHQFHDKLHDLMVETDLFEPRYIERIEYQLIDGHPRTTITYRVRKNGEFAFEDGRPMFTTRTILYTADEIEV